MKITFLARGMRPLVQVDDRPILTLLSGGVFLEIPGRNGGYEVELTLDECRRIAEAIDYEPARYAGHPPP